MYFNFVSLAAFITIWTKSWASIIDVMYQFLLIAHIQHHAVLFYNDFNVLSCGLLSSLDYFFKNLSQQRSTV